ncbi:MAG: hypothetical protein GZ088_09800 [Acidipila sp.]|nr:hypothetical protein [Acidipila sp.]
MYYLNGLGKVKLGAAAVASPARIAAAHRQAARQEARTAAQARRDPGFSAPAPMWDAATQSYVGSNVWQAANPVPAPARTVAQIARQDRQDAAAKNKADRLATAAKNKADRLATAAKNKSDRLAAQQTAYDAKHPHAVFDETTGTWSTGGVAAKGAVWDDTTQSYVGSNAWQAANPKPGRPGRPVKQPAGISPDAQAAYDYVEGLPTTFYIPTPDYSNAYAPDSAVADASSTPQGGGPLLTPIDQGADAAAMQDGSGPQNYDPSYDLQGMSGLDAFFPHQHWPQSAQPRAFNRLNNTFGKPGGMSAISDSPNLLLIGGALLAAYLLLKKR